MVTGQQRTTNSEFRSNLLTKIEELRLAPNSVISLEGSNYSPKTRRVERPVQFLDGRAYGSWAQTVVVWASASQVGRRLPIPLRSVCDPYLGNHLEGSDLPFEPQLQTAWVSCGEQTQVTSCKRGSLLLTSCTWLRQLRQHRIHVRLDGCKLIFEELHVALIK